MPHKGLSEAPSKMLITAFPVANVVTIPFVTAEGELIARAFTESICLGSSMTSG
jgi:hypothetical protein